MGRHHRAGRQSSLHLLGQTTPPAAAAPTAFKVLVAVPCMDWVASGFAHDLANLMAFSAATLLAPDDGPLEELGIQMVQNTLIHTARNEIVADAAKQGRTHILWLDADMRFPRDTLGRLLARNRSIVGANYSSRRIPVRPTAAYSFQKPFPPCYTRAQSTGLEEVAFMGFGVMLTAMEVFADVAMPCFRLEYIDEGPGRRGFQGEDVYFCEQAAAKGHKTYVDHDLSKDVGHIGQFEFGHSHANTYEWQEAITEQELTPPDEPEASAREEVAS